MRKVKEASTDELKFDYIRFRCTTAEKDMAKTLAKQEHISMSAYITRLIYADYERKHNG